ncbi:FAD-binding oxidoreductase [Dyadobacter sp. NIV53]|uniref:FAD-binding oxidoreductase n=1 Tax=Dyadobacter sp. NIV53 TaxID=2861765 RepID=UPI001C8861B3|nr:FAD-binding oxidoreductase [Dyadobacter sp. NIV53]
MANYKVKVLDVRPVTHNVHAFTIEKPEGFNYVPGQATDLSIVKENWENEKRPFTFTSLQESDFLQFTIKSYPDRNGVTNQLLYVEPGDYFEISDAWGAIEYQGEGVFLAGGAGITPFIAIFRDLYSRNKIGNNKLFFSNKTTADIILKEEFETMLGNNFHKIISAENVDGCYYGRINKGFLQENITDFTRHFYVCGPDPFIASILDALQELGAHAETLVFEK